MGKSLHGNNEDCNSFSIPPIDSKVISSNTIKKKGEGENQKKRGTNKNKGKELVL